MSLSICFQISKNDNSFSFYQIYWSRSLYVLLLYLGIMSTRFRFEAIFIASKMTHGTNGRWPTRSKKTIIDWIIAKFNLLCNHKFFTKKWIFFNCLIQKPQKVITLYVNNSKHVSGYRIEIFKFSSVIFSNTWTFSQWTYFFFFSKFSNMEDRCLQRFLCY